MTDHFKEAEHLLAESEVHFAATSTRECSADEFQEQHRLGGVKLSLAQVYATLAQIEAQRAAADAAASLLPAGERVKLFALLKDLTDPDDCYFDHHGGCQAHGYLTLQPGEMCPHAEAKAWLKENGHE